MSNYRYNRPVTALLILTLPLWAVFVAGAQGLKETWDERAMIGREMKSALAWSFEPVSDAWGGLKAWVADKVETFKLRAMIARDDAATFYRRQLRERLIALGVILLAPIAFAGALQLAFVSSITSRSVESFRSLWKEVRWFGQDFVRCMKTGKPE